MTHTLCLTSEVYEPCARSGVTGPGVSVICHGMVTACLRLLGVDRCEPHLVFPHPDALSTPLILIDMEIL